MEGRIEVKKRLRRRHIHFLYDLKERRGHWKLKEEVSDGTVWRTRIGRGCGSNCKVYACIVKHNYVLGGMLFTIRKAQLHVSATNFGHYQVVQ